MLNYQDFEGLLGVDLLIAYDDEDTVYVSDALGNPLICLGMEDLEAWNVFVKHLSKYMVIQEVDIEFEETDGD